jgi:hypothetical protein
MTQSQDFMSADCLSDKLHMLQMPLRQTLPLDAGAVSLKLDTSVQERRPIGRVRRLPADNRVPDEFVHMNGELWPLPRNGFQGEPRPRQRQAEH